MPDARFAPEGSWRTGYSNLKPYEAIWTSLTFFPWLEGSFRYTQIGGVPGGLGPDFGDFKDKSFDAKLRLLPERGWWPAIAVGAHDVGGGTGVFRARYGVASKRLGDFDFTLGYGDERIDGGFGGVRWHAAERWSVVAEYDAFDYRRDRGAELSGAAGYEKDYAVGLEYQGDWWGAKAFAAHEEAGVNAYISIPLDAPRFVPRVDEPPPYTKINPRPTEAQWAADEAHARRLAAALAAQDFRDVRLGYAYGRLEATLTNTRISSMPRAVGRAARTLLSFAPLEVREIRVTYVHNTLPVATYTFINVPLLQRYFNGMATRERLAPYVAIEYARPEEARDEIPGDEEARLKADRDVALEAFEVPLPEEIVLGRQGADLVALHGENVAGGRLRIAPALSTFFNDPSGAFKFDLAAVASWQRPLAPRTFLQATTRLTLYETVSDVTQPSNSLLPHVRTDVAEYKRGGDFKLTRLVVNRFYHPQERVYARASAGIYEEMYSGAGGQVLWLPESGDWAFDLAADYVKQRDFEGWFGHRDYETLTAIASLNYRMAQGVTATVRGGRFLARDEGLRVELKRRFRSGFQVGAWYTVTNGEDITSPGSPEEPYYDKGIFMVMPLETMLTYDTQAVATMSLSPWTRDVGQMVASPADLYRLMERPVLQVHEHDGLVGLGDRPDGYDLPRLGADRRWPDFLAEDLWGAREASGKIDWWKSAAAGAAIVLASASLDKRANREAGRHRDGDFSEALVDVGDALPIAAVGLSGLFAFDTSRPYLSDAGVAALEAAGAALLGSSLMKYSFGRARPTTGLGRSEFEPGSSEDDFQSFPSRHAAVMWAAVTPYAEEYGMPWLYGLAALTNAARTASGEHWLSDTVAGSVLGYALGHLAWQARREARDAKDGPTVAVGPGSVAVAWDF